MWAAAAFLLFLQADYTTEGMKALDEGKYEAAAQAFRKAIEADSKDYFAHFNLAMAYTLLERDPEAVTEYRKTLELKPGLYEAELNGGIVLLRQKNPVEALPLFEQAAAQKPQEFRPRYYLAESQLQTGAYAKAEESYKLAIALDAKSAAASLVWRRLWCSRENQRRRPVLPAGGAIGTEVSRLPAGTRRLYEKASQNRQAIEIYKEFPDNRPRRREWANCCSNPNNSKMPYRAWRRPLPRTKPANRSALAAAYVFTRNWTGRCPAGTIGGRRTGQLRPADDVRARVRDKRQFQPAPANSTRPPG
jgi:tetratricopeptide (TPR) repeat protein